MRSPRTSSLVWQSAKILTSGRSSPECTVTMYLAPAKTSTSHGWVILDCLSNRGKCMTMKRWSSSSSSLGIWTTLMQSSRLSWWNPYRSRRNAISAVPGRSTFTQDSGPFSTTSTFSCCGDALTESIACPILSGSVDVSVHAW